MHVHTREDESFYIIEGRMTFQVGSETLVAPAGTLVTLPRGVPPPLTLDTDHVRALNLCVPAGFEGFFRDLSVPAESLTLPHPTNEPLDIPRLLRTAERYGVEILPPK